MSKNKSGMLLAGLLGAIAGVVGGVLFAPQSGKKTRERITKLAAEVLKALRTEIDDTKDRVKEIWGKVNDDVMEKYKRIKSSVASRVAAVKTAGESIDREKYSKLVDDVVAEFRGELQATKDGAAKVAGYLKKDWNKVRKALS